MKKKVKKSGVGKDVSAEIAKLLFDRTEEWAKVQGLIQVEKSKYSNKAKKFDKIISRGDFGCQEQSVRDLVAAIIGEKLPPKKDKSFNVEFIHGVVVVLLTGTNTAYTINEPILIKDKKGYGILLDGTQPSMPIKVNSERTFRPASIEEIEELMESLLKIDNFDSLLLGMILNQIGGRDE